MRKIQMLVLILMLLAPFTISGQKIAPRGKTISRESSSAAAEREWPSFWQSFRTAINKRDRAALKGMLPSRFETNGGGDYSPEKWIRLMDTNKLWSDVQKKAALGTKPYPSDRRPWRITNDEEQGALMFAFGKDGKWRWVAVMGD